MTKNAPAELLKKFIPHQALAYCLELMGNYPFKLHVTRPRTTKAGDFCKPFGRQPIITINEDLPPLEFLLTFIHEFSHHAVFLVYGPNTAAHGKEWKLAFRTFLLPLIEKNIFPEDVKPSLLKHLKNPSASSFSDPELMMVLRRYNPAETGKTPVAMLQDGERFFLQGKTYQRIKKMRSRILCLKISDGKNYLVPGHLSVEKDITEPVRR